MLHGNNQTNDQNHTTLSMSPSNPRALLQAPLLSRYAVRHVAWVRHVALQRAPYGLILTFFCAQAVFQTFTTAYFSIEGSNQVNTLIVEEEVLLLLLNSVKA
jgi:hypothetical protein